MKRLSDVEHNNAVNLLNRGVELYNSNNYKEAIIVVDKALQLDPNNADSWNIKAAALAELGNFEDAVAALDKAIAINPEETAFRQNQSGVWHRKGLRFAKSNHFEDAINAFNKAIEVYPGLANPWYDKGLSLLMLDRFEESVTAFNSALKIKPNWIDAWNNKGHALSGLNRYAEANEAFDEAIKLSPCNDGFWYSKAYCLYRLNRNAEAIYAYDKVIEINPHYPGVWNRKTSALMKIGLFEDALKANDRLLEINYLDADEWNNRGIILTKLCRFEDALNAFDEAIKINPNHYSTWNSKGAALVQIGRFEDALAACDKAIEIDPKIAAAWSSKGLVLVKLERYKEAVDSFDKALEIDPDDSNIIKNRRMALENIDANLNIIVESKEKEANIDHIIKHVKKSLGSKNMALWCGAGISKWSGLPTAVELLECVFTQLGLSKSEIDVLTGDGRLPLPFELYIELLLEDGIDFVGDVYALGKPNRNHSLLARLMKKGKLKTIVTTNFDTLIESALEDEGLFPGNGYDRLFCEADFSGIDWSITQKRLIKIHGSVHNPASIAGTIRSIAAKEASESRKKVVERIFSTGFETDVLVMGYSCSDVFDITPQIESLGQSSKCIVLNEYSEDCSFERINIKKSRNPFRNFSNGWRLSYNTDDLVSKLWRRFFDDNPPEHPESETGWDKIVSAKMGQCHRKGILRHYYPAELLLHMGNYELCRSYLEKALQEVERTGDYTGGLYIQLTMANVCFLLGEYETARGWCEFFLEDMTEPMRNSNLCFGAYMCLGNSAAAQGDLEVAADCFEKGLQNAKKRNNPSEILSALDKAAETHIRLEGFRLGKQEKWLPRVMETLETAKQKGYKQVEGKCLGVMGCVFKDCRKDAEALRHLDAALDIAQKLGDRKNEGDWLGNIGGVYQNLCEHQKALDFYQKALCISVEIGDKRNEVVWLSNMGISYKEIKRYHEAQDCYEKAISIARTLGDIEGLGRSLNNLGNLYRIMGMFKEARQCVLEAIKIAKKTKDTHALMNRKELLKAIKRESMRKPEKKMFFRGLFSR